MWTDTSGSFGCGTVCPAVNQWLQLQWPYSYQQGEVVLCEESVTLKELLPVVLACAVWGEQWRCSVVTVHCDNTGAVVVVNLGYSRIPSIMYLLRCLFFIPAHFKITLWAVHVLGKCYAMADAISCNDLSYLFPKYRERPMGGWSSLMTNWVY